MGKTHRDNVAARKKRPGAYEKKRARRGPSLIWRTDPDSERRQKCNICGTKTRLSKMTAGICNQCVGRMKPPPEKA